MASTAELSDVYEAPRKVTDLTECYFYHSMTIPGHGEVTGEWDLRGDDEHRYLGGVALAGKRVLELGAASGFLTVHMEQQGAEVIAYDLSEDHPWDVVPFGGDGSRTDKIRRAHLRKLNNGFWLNHTAHNLSAKLVHGTVYTVPADIGDVDVATFASILLHLRDPFLALETSARLVRDTMIVTDVYPASDYHRVLDIVDAPDPEDGTLTPLPEESLGEPKATFLPQYWDRAYPDTWWHLAPAAVQRFLGVLGFERTEVTYHHALAGGRRTLLYTVVGHRR